ncbi:hypothetical protein [Streptomyces bauhiniae]|uniref:hypothetical protein n=1 Tax=Streptomyces bauhiniae TaxID=2340725 RepID=UPI0035DBF959
MIRAVSHGASAASSSRLASEAVVNGFVARPGAAEDPKECKATSRLLATVLRRAFEPIEPPAPENQDRMAAELLALRPLRSGTPMRLAEARVAGER